jgi:hypothetical protein
MSERENNVYKAKLAEQAERYDGELKKPGKTQNFLCKNEFSWLGWKKWIFFVWPLMKNGCAENGRKTPFLAVLVPKKLATSTKVCEMHGKTDRPAKFFAIQKERTFSREIRQEGWVQSIDAS